MVDITGVTKGTKTVARDVVSRSSSSVDQDRENLKLNGIQIFIFPFLPKEHVFKWGD
jgi:hypothetical protein